MNSFKLMQITTPDNQTTLAEICSVFADHTIYGIDDNETVCVLNHDGTVYATFELEENGMYEVYNMDYDNMVFAEFAHLWGDTVAKIQGGATNV